MTHKQSFDEKPSSFSQSDGFTLDLSVLKMILYAQKKGTIFMGMRNHSDMLQLKIPVAFEVNEFFTC